MDEQGAFSTMCAPRSSTLTPHTDQEWLDAVNQERRKEQLNGVTYETFEIVMDRLEKEWFDLVRASNPPLPFHMSQLNHISICRRRTFLNQIWPCPLKTLPVPFAMIRKARTAMRSYSATDVIWQYIRVCISSAYAIISNYTQDCYGVPYIPEGQWLCRKCTVSPENPVVSTPPLVFPTLLIPISDSLAYYVQMKEVLSNKPYLVNGSTCYARYGCRRHELQMRFSWNQSPGSRKSQSSVGNW